MEEIYRKIEELLAKGEYAGIEIYLRQVMADAHENENYGLYIAVGNELLSFYRQTGAFEAAFALAEDILLLMEEFNQEDSEQFALILVNAAGAYLSAGDYKGARNYFERALRILEGTKEKNASHAQILAEYAIACQQDGATKKALELFEESVALFREGAPRTKENTYFYLTALSGAGELCHFLYPEKALEDYEEAAALSETQLGNGETTQIFRKNAAVLAMKLGDSKKAEYYQS